MGHSCFILVPHRRVDLSRLVGVLFELLPPYYSPKQRGLDSVISGLFMKEHIQVVIEHYH